MSAQTTPYRYGNQNEVPYPPEQPTATDQDRARARELLVDVPDQNLSRLAERRASASTFQLKHLRRTS